MSEWVASMAQVFLVKLCAWPLYVLMCLCDARQRVSGTIAHGSHSRAGDCWLSHHLPLSLFLSLSLSLCVCVCVNEARAARQHTWTRKTNHPPSSPQPGAITSVVPT
jgi:hypothetical protein